MDEKEPIHIQGGTYGVFVYGRWWFGTLESLEHWGALEALKQEVKE